jgi:hypothetical protein
MRAAAWNWIFGLPLLGCGSTLAIPGGLGALEASDTGAPPAPAGWLIGDEEPCAAPVSPAWRDASPTVMPERSGDHDAPMALVAGPAGPSVVHTVDLRGLVQRSLTTSAVEASVQFAMPVHAFRTADLDGDGLLDLVVATDEVYLVWGFGSPSQRTELLRGVDRPGEVNKVAVLDVDDDGALDLVTLTTDHAGQADMGAELWRGAGDGTFAAPRTLGQAGDWGQVFDARVVDLDGDHDLDLYVCNDDGERVVGNKVVENDGKGGLAVGEGQGLDIAVSCMGSTFGDLNADGELDAWVGALDRQHLLLADGRGGHYDAAAAWGLLPFAPHQMAWGGAMVDLDNDGLEDLLAATSDFPGAVPVALPLLAFLQDQPGHLRPAETELGLVAVSAPRGVLARDLNADGLVDLLVSDMLRSPWLFLSEGCSEEAWLEVSAPDGAWVRVEAGGRTRVALASAEPTFSAAGPPVVHFGLGAAEEIDAIVIEAPGQPTTRLEGPLSPRRRVAWSAP